MSNKMEIDFKFDNSSNCPEKARAPATRRGLVHSDVGEHGGVRALGGNVLRGPPPICSPT